MHVSTCVSVFASVKRGLSPAVLLLTLAFAPEPVVNMLLSVYVMVTFLCHVFFLPRHALPRKKKNCYN